MRSGFWLAISLAAGLVVGAMLSARSAAQVAAPASPFTATTFDLGTYVSDVDKSVKFYTEAIGMTEVPGFSVPPEFCRDSGLTDSKELKIRVLVLGSGENGSKLKLMQVPGVETKKGDSQYVHSQFGYRYTTIPIADTDEALVRLKKAGVTPLGKSPVMVPEALAKGVALTVVRDPDGNLVELVGPKK